MGTRINRIYLLVVLVNCCVRFNNGGYLAGKMDSITNVAKNMAGFGSQDSMSVKFNNMKTKALKIDSDTTDDVTDAIGDVGEGLATVVKGIQSGSAVDIITGGLSVITAITDLFDPKFAILTEVLNVISIVFSLFGGSTGGEESTEDMIKRVVEKALTEAKAEELQAEVNGLKRLYSSLSNSIKAFKKANAVTKEQTRSFYTKGFQGIKFFGIMEHYINKWCDIGDASTYDSKPTELEEKSSRCLLMCNLYADLSVLRQILLADLSAFLAKLGKQHESDNILYLISEEQKSDRNIFKFLTDPINYRNSRYISVKYYSKHGSYPTLSAYMRILDNKMRENNEGKYFKTGVMVCDDVNLKGNCYAYKDIQDISNLQNWNDKISSLYMSLDRELTAYEDSWYRGETYGPYYGPVVFGKLPGDNEWTSIKIKDTKQNSSNMVRICEAENLDINSECALLGPKSYSQLSKINGQDWNSKIGSLSIPAGLQVSGFATVDGKAHEYGPFYGPDTINKLCAPKKWTSLTVSEVTGKSATTMVKICSEQKLSGTCCHLQVPTEVGDSHRINHQQVLALCGCNWMQSDMKIKSMKVPGGIKVDVYSFILYNGRRYGPYTGPVTIDRVDGTSKWNEYASSLKITRLF